MGLLSPTVARHVARLPQGNQAELLEVIRRKALTVHELEGVVNLVLEAPSREQQRYVLSLPARPSGAGSAAAGTGSTAVSGEIAGLGAAGDAVTNPRIEEVLSWYPARPLSALAPILRACQLS